MTLSLSRPWASLGSPFAMIALLVGAYCSAIAWTSARTTVVLEASDPALHVANGVLYRGTTPFDGAVVERHANGSEKRRTPYRSGLREGTVLVWSDDGSLLEDRSYELGKEHGTHTGWYPDGTRRFEYHYVRGLADGMQEEWYANGQPYTRFEYRAGHEEGRERMWTEQGVLRANYVVDRGRRFGLMGTTGCTGAPDSTARSERSRASNEP